MQSVQVADKPLKRAVDMRQLARTRLLSHSFKFKGWMGRSPVGWLHYPVEGSLFVRVRSLKISQMNPKLLAQWHLVNCTYCMTSVCFDPAPPPRIAPAKANGASSSSAPPPAAPPVQGWVAYIFTANLSHKLCWISYWIFCLR